MLQENDVAFDESSYKIKSRVILGQSEVPGMTQFLLRKGMVKNEKQATYIMIALICITCMVTFFLLYSNFSKSAPVPEMSADERMSLEAEMQLNQ